MKRWTIQHKIRSARYIIEAYKEREAHIIICSFCSRNIILLFFPLIEESPIAIIIILQSHKTNNLFASNVSPVICRHSSLLHTSVVFAHCPKQKPLFLALNIPKMLVYYCFSF